MAPSIHLKYGKILQVQNSARFWVDGRGGEVFGHNGLRSYCLQVQPILGCVQMIGISTKEVLSRTSIQVMLENTSVYNIVTRASHGVLLKTNEFVKQVSILLTFFFTLSF